MAGRCRFWLRAEMTASPLDTAQGPRKVPSLAKGLELAILEFKAPEALPTPVLPPQRPLRSRGSETAQPRQTGPAAAGSQSREHCHSALPADLCKPSPGALPGLIHGLAVPGPLPEAGQSGSFSALCPAQSPSGQREEQPSLGVKQPGSPVQLCLSLAVKPQANSQEVELSWAGDGHSSFLSCTGSSSHSATHPRHLQTQGNLTHAQPPEKSGEALPPLSSQKARGLPGSWRGAWVSCLPGWQHVAAQVPQRRRAAPARTSRLALRWAWRYMPAKPAAIESWPASEGRVGPGRCHFTDRGTKGQGGRRPTGRSPRSGSPSVHTRQAPRWPVASLPACLASRPRNLICSLFRTLGLLPSPGLGSNC
ncbi:uncharacterized protein LOC144335569 [Macaca mulatta]